ncbi:hypothetical protein JCM19037_2346 [Geomicrobium sp. JCM 19037]|uniref:hypothetical protein n=1 Tax=Geomicrobium sp. JCM 19037 TaxID=1460634 RepID=UPI00045F24F4|nr:hypothetical protein [Geomicrobium sp. JCM 19037]GAK03978.1 hypothetical protein JCM19037_2346 [Geomicrobium sp. JCM 19037]
MKVMTLFTLTGFLVILAAFTFVTMNAPDAEDEDVTSRPVAPERSVEDETTDSHSETAQEVSQPRPPAPENVEITGTFLTWHAVREDDIRGYRIYKGSGSNFEPVATVTQSERKTYTDDDIDQLDYYVTTIAEDGTESEPSNKVSQ